MKEIDLSLDRVNKVLQRCALFLPSKIITVGGTNGKGSTVKGLETIYLQGGYSVGAYTSPYLLHYNEQIRVNGVPATDEKICAAFLKIKSAMQGILLTPFEFATLAALVVFAESRLDVVILEVGLGGRLDAVNAIDPDIAIVTSIAIDHVEWLGGTRESIAREKAGIFRSLRPAICGDFDPPDTLIEHALDIKAQLFCQNQAFQFKEKQNTWDWWSENIILKDLPKPQLALQNMSCVLLCVQLLQATLPIGEQTIRESLKQMHLMGRLQIIPGEIPVLLDVSHNPASAAMLAEFLVKNPISGKTHAVFSMLKDKDIEETVAVVKENIDYWHIAPLPEPRGSTKRMLQKVFAHIAKARIYDNIMDAFRSAEQMANKQDRIVVFGSFHTVAYVIKQQMLCSH
jgi:dihydrofolate synthase/folylpolyglutamate synthase